MTQAHVNSKQYMQTILPIDKFHTRFLAHYDLSPTDIFGTKAYGPNIEDSTILYYSTERLITRGADTYILDKSKASHYGKINGATIVAGMDETAFNFDGTDDYIETRLRLPSNGTIEMWYKPTSFYDFNTLWDNSVHANAWECWIYSTGIIAARLAAGSPTVSYDLTALGGSNNWYHIVFTWERFGNIKLFVNGILRSTQSTVWTAPGEYVYFGGGNSGNTKGTGVMDRVAVFDSVITETEVKQRYRRGIYLIADNGKFDKCISISKPRGLSYMNPISGCRQFTIAFWANITALNSNNTNTLLSINNYAAAYTQTAEICIDTLTADSNKIRMLTYNDSLATTILTGPVCQLNTWTHFAFVRETNKNIMYINGVKVTEGAASTYSMAGGVMQIGARDSAEPRYIEGMLIDELRIDDIARTADEIYQWYNSSTPFYPKGMERMV